MEEKNGILLEDIKFGILIPGSGWDAEQVTLSKGSKVIYKGHIPERGKANVQVFYGNDHGNDWHVVYVGKETIQHN